MVPSGRRWRRASPCSLAHGPKRSTPWPAVTRPCNARSWSLRTAGWLEAERRFYEAVEASYLPGFLGACAHPMLVVEDLSGARWLPPWRPGDVEAVLEALRALGLPTSW